LRIGLPAASGPDTSKKSLDGIGPMLQSPGNAHVVQKIMDETKPVPGADVPPVTPLAASPPGTSPAVAPSSSNPPDNELFREIPSPAESPSLEKVRAASDGVFARFGQFIKRGRGRPKKDGSPKISDVVFPAAPPGLAAPQAPGAPSACGPSDSAIVRAALEKAGKAAASWGDRLVKGKALAATGDSAYAEKLAALNSATPEEIGAFVDLGEIAVKQLKIHVWIVPIVSAGIVLGSGAARYASTIKELNRQIALKEAKENPQTPNPATP
jgi:hypothetical protein